MLQYILQMNGNWNCIKQGSSCLFMLKWVYFFLKKSLFIEKILRMKIYYYYFDKISIRYEILKLKYHKYENFIIYIFSRILSLKLGNISFIYYYVNHPIFLFINHVLELCIQKNRYWDLIKQGYSIPYFVKMSLHFLL